MSVKQEIPELPFVHKAAIAVLSVLLFFGAAEFLCRLFYHPADNLSLITGVLERDSSLIWKNRPGLDGDFQGVPVKTDSFGFRVARAGASAPGFRRIVCMGASPDFGWGVQAEEVYSSRLEKLLAASGLNYEVINAGMTGHSSAQGLALFQKKIAGMKPDIVTIPYAVNDVDRHRFFRDSPLPDNELKPQGRIGTALLNISDRSRFITWYRSVLIAGMSRLPAPVVRYQRHVRVPPGYYEANLRALAAAVKAAGAAPVFIVMPVRAPSLSPSLIKDAPLSDRLAEEGFLALEKSDMAGAGELLASSVASNPYNPAAYFYLAQLARRKGDRDGASAYGKKMLEAELYACSRESAEYNRVMRSLGKELGIPVVDVAILFSNVGPAPDPRYYVNPLQDFVHPNASGHSLIAGALYNIIIRMGGAASGK